MLPWIAGILLGALAPALIVALLSQKIMILPLAFAVTLGHSIVLGLPAALFYRARRWTRLSTAIAGAFLIGATPYGIFAWPMSLSSKTQASFDGVPTIIDGIPTLAGWFAYLEGLVAFGGLGAVGGLVFWSTMRWSGLLDIRGGRLTAPLPRKRRIGAWITGTAVIAAVAVFMLPALTMDRSCHNPFRYGRWSISSKVNIDLDIPIGDWSRLAQLFENFAASRQMSFRNLSESRPGVVEILSISVCGEDGLQLSANEQIWNTQTHTVLRGDRGVPIGVYDLRDGNDWQSVARELVTALESEWRGKVRFRDGSGRFVSRPDELTPKINSNP